MNKSSVSCVVYFIVFLLFTTTAKASLIYQLSSSSDPSTFGTVTVDTNLGNTYDASTDWIDWDFTIVNVAFNPSNSKIFGGVGLNSFVATTSDPFGASDRTANFSGKSATALSPFTSMAIARDNVAGVNAICAGRPSSCVSIYGGTLVSNVSWSLVPIPAAIWLFGSGLLGMIGIARRKKTA